VTGLSKRAKEVVCNEHHAKEQHALVKPAGHTPRQWRCKARMSGGWLGKGTVHWK
jgi:hypothetical protein